jgi:hypothetical protein
MYWLVGPANPFILLGKNRPKPSRFAGITCQVPCCHREANPFLDYDASFSRRYSASQVPTLYQQCQFFLFDCVHSTSNRWVGVCIKEFRASQIPSL